MKVITKTETVLITCLNPGDVFTKLNEPDRPYIVITKEKSGILPEGSATPAVCLTSGEVWSFSRDSRAIAHPHAKLVLTY